MDTPMAIQHSNGMYITHPRDIHRCFVFDKQLFEVAKFLNRQNQSVNKRLSICLVPAHPIFSVEKTIGMELCKVIEKILPNIQNDAKNML